MPVAFIYLSPFLVGVDAYIDPRADVGIRPYNINFTNYDAIICKRGRFILQDLLLKLNVLYYMKNEPIHSVHWDFKTTIL